jgi:hypothetical protein
MIFNADARSFALVVKGDAISRHGAEHASAARACIVLLKRFCCSSFLHQNKAFPLSRSKPHQQSVLIQEATTSKLNNNFHQELLILSHHV